MCFKTTTQTIYTKSSITIMFPATSGSTKLQLIFSRFLICLDL